MGPKLKCTLPVSPLYMGRSICFLEEVRREGSKNCGWRKRTMQQGDTASHWVVHVNREKEEGRHDFMPLYRQWSSQTWQWQKKKKMRKWYLKQFRMLTIMGMFNIQDRMLKTLSGFEFKKCIRFIENITLLRITLNSWYSVPVWWRSLYIISWGYSEFMISKEKLN